MWSHLFPHQCCCYLYSPSSHCRAKPCCMCHRYYRESPTQACLGGCGQFTGCKQLSQATTLKSTAHSPHIGIRWRLSNLSSFMYYFPGCPTAGGGGARHWSHLTETLVELIHLNYSSYMRAIAFKGTDMSLCPLPILSH